MEKKKWKCQLQKMAEAGLFMPQVNWIYIKDKWSCNNVELHKSSLAEPKFNKLFLLKYSVFTTKKLVVAERQEAALMTAFNLLTLPALTTYLCLFPAKSIWKGEEASVTHRKSREVWEQGFGPGFIGNSFTELRHFIFSKFWCN